MSNKATETRQLPLRECARRLAEPTCLGEAAPAYVTLKRWASEGRLKAAQVSVTGAAHPKYQLDQLVLVAKRWSGKNNAQHRVASRSEARSTPLNLARREESNAKHASKPREPLHRAVQPPVSPGETEFALGQLKQIQATLSEIQTALTTVGQQDSRIANGLSNLDAARKQLMGKYDAEATSLKARVAELVAENAHLRQMHTPIDAAKNNMLLARVSAQLTTLNH